ncbi:MAG: YfhO family protein, partial [Bacteroidales bacterium]|nr:YfhO family protein [Lachnoclostridium sp.]MCM1385069.1 YfhO family protein [Lachnoclostridium sp.]MCM1465299.1 YfhO family protein [Bacteroidales bacterium]
YRLKEKLSYGLMAAAPFAGFLWQGADLAWHGFQYPNAVPYRYAFLFSTVVLILAWKAYVCIPLKGGLPKLIGGLVGCYLCIELFFNGAAMINGIHKEKFYQPRFNYDLVMDYVLPLTEEIREEDGFFRSEVMMRYLDYNEPTFYGLRGISSFHSASNRDVRMFLFIMGNVLIHPVADGGGMSPVGDSLLGVKYRITQDKFLDGYELKDISKGQLGSEFPWEIYLQENKNVLSLGYMVNRESILEGCEVGTDVFENQNLILKAMGVKEPEVFRKLDIEISEEQDNKNLKFTTLSDNPVYCYLWGSKELMQYSEENGEWEELEAEINTRLNEEEERNIVIDSTTYLGSFEKGTQLSMELDMEGGDITLYDAYVYELDKEKYEAAMSELREGEFQITSINGGQIKGMAKAEEGQMLFLPLVTDGGWQITVDGETSPYAVVLGMFLGVPLTEGEHQIEINYMPFGLKEGIAGGIVAFALVLLYFGMGGKRLISLNSRKPFCEK